MSAGCIPKKEDRIAVVARAVEALQKAIKILKKYPDPDKGKREVEEASGLVSRILGDFYDDGTDPSDLEAPKKPGLRRLTEHYFS